MPVMKKVCLAAVAFVSTSLAAATEAAVVAPTPTGLRSGASASPATTAPSSISAPTKPTASTAVDVAKGANMKNFTYGGDSAKECTAAYEAAFLSVDRDSPDFAAQVQAAISQLPDGTNGAIDCRDSQLYKYKPPANPAVVGSGYGLNSKTGECFVSRLWPRKSSFSDIFNKKVPSPSPSPPHKPDPAPAQRVQK